MAIIENYIFMLNLLAMRKTWIAVLKYYRPNLKKRKMGSNRRKKMLEVQERRREKKEMGSIPRQCNSSELWPEVGYIIIDFHNSRQLVYSMKKLIQKFIHFLCHLMQWSAIKSIHVDPEEELLLTFEDDNLTQEIPTPAIVKI